MNEEEAIEKYDNGQSIDGALEGLTKDLIGKHVNLSNGKQAKVSGVAIRDGPIYYHSNLWYEINLN